MYEGNIRRNTVIWDCIIFNFNLRNSRIYVVNICKYAKNNVVDTVQKYNQKIKTTLMTLLSQTTCCSVINWAVSLRMKNKIEVSIFYGASESIFLKFEWDRNVFPKVVEPPLWQEKVFLPYSTVWYGISTANIVCVIIRDYTWFFSKL